MLAVLGIDAPSTALLRELEAPAAGPAVELFPDVRRVLEQLRASGVGMAVVSDNRAGLENTYRDLGIGHYFAGVVISEVLGCNKPDPRMHSAGRGLFGLDPGACLVVDDDPELVLVAIQLGYHGVALTRDLGPALGVPACSGPSRAAERRAEGKWREVPPTPGFEFGTHVVRWLYRCTDEGPPLAGVGTPIESNPNHRH